MKAYIADLAAYNQGDLIGQWIDLDGKDASDIQEEIAALLAQWTAENGELREEYAVHDWEMPSGFDACTEYPDWDDVAAIVAACGEHGEDVVSAALSCDVPIESIGDAYAGSYDSETDYTQQYLDDTGALQDIPEHLRIYFDYDAFARDAFIDSVMGERVGGMLHVFYRNY